MGVEIFSRKYGHLTLVQYIKQTRFTHAERDSKLSAILSGGVHWVPTATPEQMVRTGVRV